jgi:hypothetical protein
MFIENNKFKRIALMSICSLLILLAVAACGDAGSGSATPTPTGSTPGSGAQASPTTQATTTPTTQPPSQSVPLKITSVSMAVSPTSIAGMSCGANVTVTYTATFHAVSGSNGGAVQFLYTVNNGRGQGTASINFAADQTTRTYTFTWSGALPLDHTYPEPGGVIVTSPNTINSPLVGPTGVCSPAAFKVIGVSMAVNPTSIAGLSCGTNLTVTYTATFHVAPDSNGGTIQFQYTVNNGRGTTASSLNFTAGVTTMTYSFTWSGALPPDHTYPEPGGVIVTSPNSVNPQLIGPAGSCV